jgi:hypothetical protein
VLKFGVFCAMNPPGGVEERQRAPSAPTLAVQHDARAVSSS